MAGSFSCAPLRGPASGAQDNSGAERMALKESVLITGGAGYIGSHTVLAFREAGYPVVVLDDLSMGHRAAVPGDVPFVEGDVGDIGAVRSIIARHGIAAVVHLAARASVPESVRDPLLYYRNNSGASANMVRACLDSEVRRFVFSSTAAVYGVPGTIPVPEDAPTAPINPYGNSKLVTEWMLRDAAAAHDFHYVALRYFNVAGADPKGRAGQSGVNGVHLLKAACEAAVGLRSGITVFGADYDTADGTGVRDYIHVSDLARDHVAALRHLEEGGGSRVFNCGYGRGVSVREALEAVQAVSGARFEIREGPRRAGDPPALVADSSWIREELGSAPHHDDLEFIIRTALSWERKQARQREAAAAACSP